MLTKTLSLVRLLWVLFVTRPSPWEAGGSSVKNPPAGDLRDAGLIPGWGRSPGGGHGNPSSFLDWRNPWTEKPGDYSPQVAKSQTWLGSTQPTPGLVLGPHSPVSARVLLSQFNEIPYPRTSLSHLQSYHPSLPLARTLSSCFRATPLSNFSFTYTHLAPWLSTPICPCCIQNEA